MAGDRHTDWESFELDSGVRQSVHIWTKAVPVDVTLTTPGTAQDLYTINPDLPTINLATNPSFETGTPPTGYTATGSALAQSATVARTGTNSLRITPNNAAAGEGAFWTSDDLLGTIASDRGLFLVVSAYFQDNVGSGNGARIVIADTTGATLVNGNTVALSAAWQRSSAALRLSDRDPARYRVYFVTATQFATVFYVDSFQAELQGQNTPTTYCDGAQGVFYEWDGTAHASFSRRRLGLSAVRGYTLHSTRDVYLAEDQTASSTTGRYVRAGTDFWEDFPLNVERNLSILNVVAGEAPRVYGVVRGVHSQRM